jgi:tetrapyrrole methylase family protein/MazG family protein
MDSYEYYTPKQDSVMFEGFKKNSNSLEQAQFVKKISTEIGFDTNDSIEKAFLKINEEFNELKDEIDKYLKDNLANNIINIKKEVGDLLFSIGGLANKFDFKMEECLKMTIDKFIFRRCYVEDELKKKGKNFENGNMEEMCKWWKEAKKIK